MRIFFFFFFLGSTAHEKPQLRRGDDAIGYLGHLLGWPVVHRLWPTCPAHFPSSRSEDGGGPKEQAHCVFFYF